MPRYIIRDGFYSLILAVAVVCAATIDEAFARSTFKEATIATTVIFVVFLGCTRLARYVGEMLDHPMEY